MTLTVYRTGERVRCEKCPRTVAIIQDGKLFVKAGDQTVVTGVCSVICKCGYWNHVALRDDTVS